MQQDMVKLKSRWLSEFYNQVWRCFSWCFARPSVFLSVHFPFQCPVSLFVGNFFFFFEHTISPPQRLFLSVFTSRKVQAVYKDQQNHWSVNVGKYIKFLCVYVYGSTTDSLHCIHSVCVCGDNYLSAETPYSRQRGSSPDFMERKEPSLKASCPHYHFSQNHYGRDIH